MATLEKGPQRIYDAPVDHLAVPLPIIPSKRLNTHSIRKSSSYPKINKHHEFFLPYETFKTLGAQATRSSRILRAETEVHNHGSNGFHRFYNRSDVPATEQGQFDVVLLSAAGYLPERGVDLWSGEPIERDLEDWERNILTTPDSENSKVYRNLLFVHDDAKRFMERFVLGQARVNQDPHKIDYFKAERKFRFTKRLGQEIVNSAIASATSSVAEAYAAAAEKKLLHPRSPISAEEVVKDMLGANLGDLRVLQKLRHFLIKADPLQTGVNELELQMA